MLVANQRAGLDSVRHTLLHQIIPRSLGQDGQLALHASAVEIDGQEGIVFAGPSGAGKSTLAQSFEGGADRAFADDCVLMSDDIDETSAIPAVSLRSAASDLEPAGGAAQRRDTISIGAVFFVNDAAIPSADARPWIQPMDAAEGTMAMIRRRFSIDNKDMEVESRVFRRVSRIISSGVRVFRLQYPHDYSLLPEVRRSIGAELGLAID